MYIKTMYINYLTTKHHFPLEAEVYTISRLHIPSPYWVAVARIGYPSQSIKVSMVGPIQSMDTLWRVAASNEYNDGAWEARELSMALPPGANLELELLVGKRVAEVARARFGVASQVTVYCPSDEKGFISILSTTRRVADNGVFHEKTGYFGQRAGRAALADARADILRAQTVEQAHELLQPFFHDHRHAFLDYNHFMAALHRSQPLPQDLNFGVVKVQP